MLVIKKLQNVTEKSFRNTEVDLVPSLRESIKIPITLLSVAKGWIRGGSLPEDTRDNDYFNEEIK